MNRELSVERVIEKWLSEREQQQPKTPAQTRRNEVFMAGVLKLLAEGHPVTPQAAVEATGLPLEEISAQFEAVRAQGGEVDASGNLVGLALTLNPTPHRFLINNHLLYAWCSLDTIFLPGLLGETAQVESTCPVTGEAIHLIAAPDGIVDYHPKTVVLSITVPGLSCRRIDDPAEKAKTGPGSDSCGQMYFFANRTAAGKWLKDHPNVAIFTPEEAYRLADANWISPHRAVIVKADL